MGAAVSHSSRCFFDSLLRLRRHDDDDVDDANDDATDERSKRHFHFSMPLYLSPLRLSPIFYLSFSPVILLYVHIQRLYSLFFLIFLFYAMYLIPDNPMPCNLYLLFLLVWSLFNLFLHWIQFSLFSLVLLLIFSSNLTNFLHLSSFSSSVLFLDPSFIFCLAKKFDFWI